jgi:hypothetical protein
MPKHCAASKTLTSAKMPPRHRQLRRNHTQ